MTAKARGAFCQSLAMAFSVWIAAFHAKAERTEHGFGVFQFVRKLFQAKKRIYPREEFFRKNWFVEEVVGTGFDAAQFSFPVGEAGDQYKRYQSRGGITFQLAAKFVSGFSWHHDIGKHEI